MRCCARVGRSIFLGFLLSSLVTVQPCWTSALLPASWGPSHWGGGDICWELGSFLHPATPKDRTCQRRPSPQTEAASGASLLCFWQNNSLPSTRRGFGVGAGRPISLCLLAAPQFGNTGVSRGTVLESREDLGAAGRGHQLKQSLVSYSLASVEAACPWSAAAGKGGRNEGEHGVPARLGRRRCEAVTTGQGKG